MSKKLGEFVTRLDCSFHLCDARVRLFIFRLWYILDPPSTCNHNNTSDDDHDDPTSLSVRAAAAAVISRSATSLSSASAKGPTQISYKNILPECLDENAKYPVYEQLPDTFDVTNDLLMENNPFEG